MDIIKQEMMSSDENSSGDSYSENEDKIQNNKRKPYSNYANNNKKMKVDAVQRKQKKGKNDLYKAPTMEELSHLQETQNLYKSNLFRMQIKELLTEINVAQNVKNLFNDWFEKMFKQFVANLQEYGEVKLSELLEKGNKKSLGKSKNFINKIKKVLNFENPEINKSDVKTDHDVTIKFVKPEQCSTFGLHTINSTVGPQLTVDINITMPKSCFLEKDYLNNRYVVKRNYYLLYIYLELQKTDLCATVPLCDLKNAVLTLVPSISNEIQIRVYVTPAENSFKLSRFEAEKNNMRDKNLFHLLNDVETTLLKDCGTPYYNSILLHDMTLASNYDFVKNQLGELENVQDGIKLLLVWLQQRGLRLNGFTDNLLLQTMLYLTVKGKINSHMSSYQVIRNFWVFLSTTNWHEKPISICEDVKEDRFKSFREHFDVVFLDNSGCYNLTAFLYLDVYMKLRSEAELAVTFLDDSRLDSFQALFMVTLNPEMQYDALLRLSDSTGFKNICESISNIRKCRFVGCFEMLVIKEILQNLKQGLHKRIVHIVPLTSEKCENGYFKDITLGLTLDPSNAFKVLEKGPSPNSPEGKAFNEFWGNLSELRKFADDSVCEAVYFPAETFQEKRQIFKKVINHVVTERLKIEKYQIISDQLEEMLVLKDYVVPFPSGTCEEASLKIITIFDELSKKLREFSLPLEITTVQGASEVFSYTTLFPPIPTNYKWGGKITTVQGNNIVLREHGKLGTVPRYVEPIECVIQLGMNSKWPSNLEALRQLKLGFYVEVAKLLDLSDIISSVKSECLDVFYKGLVFRFRLYHPKELSIIKKYVRPDGITAYKDTEESIEMDKNLNILPKIIGALNGIQSQYPSFGPSTTLIKRWLRSQLIDEHHIPDIVISLLNVALYLHNAPYNIAVSPQVSFLRFLQHYKNFDWNSQFVIVNFNDALRKEDLDSFEANFHQNRKTYPPLCIVTPFDEQKSRLSKKCSVDILRRLSILAQATCEIVRAAIPQHELSSTMRELFIPNLGGYNLLIHLRPLMNPKRHQQLDFVRNSESKITVEEYKVQQSTKMPVIGFNPPEIYLRELRQHYGEFAEFFHDPNGGNIIGVLWRPSAVEKKEFKVSHVAGRKLVNNNLVLNTSAIIEDFYVLGTGLVKTIEERN